LDHSVYTGLAWPKVETMARRLKVSIRTVQRGLDDLLATGWIGTPFGGGSREGVVYHLHPDAKPCLFCIAPARTLNHRGHARTGAITPPVSHPTGAKLTSVTDAKMAAVPGPTGDILSKRGDIFDGAYKERHSLITISKSTAAAAHEMPDEFVSEMDREIELDEGALRRLWKSARTILPDATPEEIRYFFTQRAKSVFRNRRIDNPVGILLSSVPDWFSKRRVTERRIQERQAAEECETLRRQIAELSASPDERIPKSVPVELQAVEPKPPVRAPLQDLTEQLQSAAHEKDSSMTRMRLATISAKFLVPGYATGPNSQIILRLTAAPAKTTAVRAYGKLGGRPKNVHADRG
jgi:hypothetical protein